MCIKGAHNSEKQYTVIILIVRVPYYRHAPEKTMQRDRKYSPRDM